MPGVTTGYRLFRPGVPGDQTHLEWMDLPEVPSLADLRAAIEPLIDGQHLEHVAVLYGGERRDLFVGETSALDRRPVNDAATAIYRTAWLTRHPDAVPGDLPAIYGPAVLVLRPVWR